MALPEYDKLKATTKQKIMEQGQQEDDAIKRRFSAMGALNSGAYTKQLQTQADSLGKRADEAVQGVDLAAAGEEQRRKEIGEARAFSSGEAQKARDVESAFREKAFGFDKESKLRQLDLAEKTYELEKQAQEFNMAMEAAKSGNDGGGSLGKFLGDSSKQYGQVGGAVAGLVGGIPGAIFGKEVGGTIGNAVGGVIGGITGGGGGTFFCSEMMARGLATRTEIRKMGKLREDSLFSHPQALLFYYEHGPYIVSVANHHGLDWSTQRKVIIDESLSLMKKNMTLAKDHYASVIYTIAGMFPETKSLKPRGYVSALARLLFHDRTWALFLGNGGFRGSKQIV